MNWFHLPSSIQLAILTHSAFTTVSAIPSHTQPRFPNDTRAIPSTGNGSEYANACWTARMSFDSLSIAWTDRHKSTIPTTETLGATTTTVTFYENATTLCDGRPRVTYSPAISLSTGIITIPPSKTGVTTIYNTAFLDYSHSRPTCSILPTDCDGLWSQYTASTSAASTITPAPFLETPPCYGVSVASSLAAFSSSLYGCGKCTIYGQGVQLVYFPTTVTSRDYCASTPVATLTHYGPSAVITAFSGRNFTKQEDNSDGSEVVVTEGHTFTSGTAYISIATVSASDRCGRLHGTPVTDAILALPSESVLSLRYSQDHFQRLMETERITGYPISYADFNTPIPWSAWNGQNTCGAGGYGGYLCSIIYEDSFRPQLAIPPQITDLSPEFKGCQMWYNGLWDPPLALQPADSVAEPTLPHHMDDNSRTAAPSSTPSSPASPPTALANELPMTTPGNSYDPQMSSSSQSITSGPTAPNVGPALPTLPTKNANPYDPDSEPWIHSFDLNGRIVVATGMNHEVKIDGVSCTSGGPAQTLLDNYQVSYGSNGLVVEKVTSVQFDSAGNSPQTSIGIDPQATPPPVHPETEIITMNGKTVPAVQNSEGAAIIIDGSVTVVPGKAPVTLTDGEIFSAASDKIIVAWSSTLGVETTHDVSTSSASPSKTGASSAASSAGSSGGASTTNSAANLSPPQVLGLLTTVMALIFVAAGT